MSGGPAGTGRFESDGRVPDVAAIPQVSVVMPAFNQAAHVGSAVRSVVGQTFAEWELLVVDDGSTDGTGDLAAACGDSRVRVIRQPNAGVSTARNVGIAAARGVYVGFLDADDLYTPAKLAAHAAHLDRAPGAGLSYSGRVEMDESGAPVGLSPAAADASLTALVLGFPFAPSDIVVRREWLDRVGGFRAGFVINEDRDLYVRLALAGCRSEGLVACLSFRRLHRARRFANLPARMDDMCRALAAAFDDPRCPPDVRACRNQAHSRAYFAWAYQAALQEEEELALGYAREMVRLEPVHDGGRAVILDVIAAAIRDGADHEARLRRACGLLGRAIPGLTTELRWALGRADLVAGLRAVLWDRLDQGRGWLKAAAMASTNLDTAALQDATHDWMTYRACFGEAQAGDALRRMVASLRSVGLRAMARRFEAACLINQAFEDEGRASRNGVARAVARAVVRHPAYLANRGVLALWSRSMRASLRRSGGADPRQSTNATLPAG